MPAAIDLSALETGIQDQETRRQALTPRGP